MCVLVVWAGGCVRSVIEGVQCIFVYENARISVLCQRWCVSNKFTELIGI